MVRERKLYAVKGVAFIVKVGLKNIVHLLDQDGVVSLTNRLSLDFLEEVKVRLGIPKDEKVRFICYHTDLTITEFTEDEKFVFLEPNDPLVDQEFNKEMFYTYGQ